MCPHCHQNAPIVYRGMVPYCTACDAVRAPFSGSSVNLTGKPAKVGGTVANAAGVLVLMIGLTVALLAGLIPTALGAPSLGLALGLPIGLLTIAAAIALFLGGRSLRKTGTDAADRTREQAIFALAYNRGGILRADDVAKTLGVPAEEADAQLTALAKQQGERVTLEIDENGGIFYRFGGVPGAPEWPSRIRVAPVVDSSAVHQRVDSAAGASEEEELEAMDPSLQAHAPRGTARGQA